MSARPILKLKRPVAIVRGTEPAPGKTATTLPPTPAAEVECAAPFEPLLTKFWFVWAEGRRASPRMRHGSLEAARAEAQRERKALHFMVYEARRIDAPSDGGCAK